MKKFLIVAHYSRFLIQFEMNDVKLLQSLGFEVHYATNYQQEDMFSGAIELIQDNEVILHQIDFVRSPYKILANIKAYRQLKDLMVKEEFSGVHCHTPMAGALSRLAANVTHTTPVIYTAHGFHFYKGCPLKNRLIYQTAETSLARYTDAQITINQEDFVAAQKFPLRGKAYYVPGVGVNVGNISSMFVDRVTKREELGIPQDAIVFITVGELIPRKNQEFLIRVFSNANLTNAHLLICGSGKEKEHLERQIQQLKIADKIHLLGFCQDVYVLLKCSDVFVFPSIQEGLPVALMEAMAAGLPCIASRIRGNVDLLKKSRYLFEPTDENKLCQLLNDAANGIHIEQECEMNRETLKKYDIKNVGKEMQSIYSTVIEGVTKNESFTSIKK